MAKIRKWGKKDGLIAISMTLNTVKERRGGRSGVSRAGLSGTRCSNVQMTTLGAHAYVNLDVKVDNVATFASLVFYPIQHG